MSTALSKSYKWALHWWPEVTNCYHQWSSVHNVKCAKGLTPPCRLYSVIWEWLIRAPGSRVSAHLLGKKGTDSLLILTVAPIKGIFLMSRKHCFLIRDMRPINQKRQGSSCGERLAHNQPQTLNSWLWPIITSRQDVACEDWSHVHTAFHFDPERTEVFFLLVSSKKPHSDQLSELKLRRVELTVQRRNLTTDWLIVDLESLVGWRYFLRRHTGGTSTV